MSDSDFANLRGKELERADMTGARFTTVSLNRATLHEQLWEATLEEWWHRMYAERDLAVLQERD